MDIKYIKTSLKSIYDRHDVYCNQKYGEDDYLPYSFHLKMVVSIVMRFIDLIEPYNRLSVIIGAGGHDLIEDARMTYNDIENLFNKHIAEIVFLCSETRGRNRNERHSAEFFNSLKENRLAVFVKLCDILANATYSRAMGSTMFEKYKKEYKHVVEELYISNEYEPLWTELELMLS